jgi:hypothetical protein
VRHEGGRVWIYTEAHKTDALFRIEAIACELKLENVYAKV